MIYFVTGSKNKFEEVQNMLELPLEQLNIDLPEPQSLDAHEIIRQKLLAAEEHAKGEYIVEDTSLYLEALGGKLPGPFIKWFSQVLRPEGLADMAIKLGNTKALAQSIIGFANERGEMHFFEGSLQGTIVAPRGDKDFGWGPAFLPEGSSHTFGEMEREEKYRINMRTKAIEGLRSFLEQRGEV